MFGLLLIKHDQYGGFFKVPGNPLHAAGANIN
jgi:hypothetical protein